MAHFKKKHVPRRRGDDIALEPGRSIQQTVKRDGKRVVIKQTMKSDGSVSTKVTTAHTLERDLQAEQVTALKAHPDYGKRFLLAGSLEAGKRGPVAAAEAKATGMEAGEPDVRLYLEHGRVLFVENKNGAGYLSQEQKDRHELMRLIGHDVWIIKTDDTAEASYLAVELVEDALKGVESIERKGRWRSE